MNGSKLRVGVESVRKDKEQDKQETEKLLQTGQSVSQCTGVALIERAHQHGVDLGLRSQCWAGARLEEVSYMDFILVLWLLTRMH